MSFEELFYRVDVRDILFSLIPLILIVIFSWIFSLLGSRMKQKAEEAKESGEGWTEEEFLQLFTRDDEDEERKERYDQSEYPSYQMSDQEAYDYGMQEWERRTVEAGGPVVTPDPIKPKWWA